MIFGNNCWPDVEAADKDKTVVVPLGNGLGQDLDIVLRLPSGP